MMIIKQEGIIKSHLRALTKSRLRVGFIPTMGALHAGHISLIKRSRQENDITVASIFVNPTQFNDPKDFEKYPVTIEKDIQLLTEAGTDILFLPDVAEIYPDGTASTNNYPLGELETLLEGKYRPGHFQGVCQVVHRLLEIIAPNRLYLGQKDYQQCMVINKLKEIEDITVEIVISPTLRESDGLAMSSRNMRLSAAERAKASCIYQAMDLVRQQIQPGSTRPLKETALQLLLDNDFKPDYLEIAHPETLAPVESWNGHDPLVILVAAFLNQVRLIDNLLIMKEEGIPASV
jgi:pantoate--beta-alanine ligase